MFDDQVRGIGHSAKRLPTHRFGGLMFKATLVAVPLALIGANVSHATLLPNVQGSTTAQIQRVTDILPVKASAVRSSAKKTQIVVNAPKKALPDSHVTVFGIVRPRAAGIEVRRMMALQGKWTLRDITSTASDGSYRFDVGPFPPKTLLTYKIVVLARPGFKRGESRVFQIQTTRATPVQPSAVSLVAPATVSPSSFVTLYGAVSPAREGVVVVRQRFLNGEWSSLAQTTTLPGGMYSFTVGRFSELTIYKYRVVALAGAGYGDAISPEVLVSSI